MTLAQSLHKAGAVLAAAGIDDALLVSELCLRHTLGIGRTQLYASLQSSLTPEHEAVLWGLIERARRGEPAAYITGHREFYGLDFYVDPRVLIPRPETELLAERTIRMARDYPECAIADIGTGSGAIAISLALNLPQARVFATDISAAALEVARLNCRRHGVAGRVHLLDGDLLDPLPHPVDFIVANLPYVRQADTRSALLSYEPRLALDGGADGLASIERLCRQAGGKLDPGGHLLIEVGQGQAGAVVSFVRRLFPGASVDIAADLSGIERVIDLSLPQLEYGHFLL